VAKFIAPASEGAGFYLNKDERAEIVSEGTPLTVVSVDKRSDTYQGKTREVYVVTFDIDGEERGWSFGVGSSDGSETSRDRLFDALTDYLTTDDSEPTQVVVNKIGAFQSVEVYEGV
jgi:hypothetical protein